MVDERISGAAVPAPTRAADRTIAFEAFAEQHLPDAYRLASAVLGNPSEAEDAVHDSFLAAWRKWDALRNRDAMSRWFDAIVAARPERRPDRALLVAIAAQLDKGGIRRTPVRILDALLWASPRPPAWPRATGAGRTSSGPGSSDCPLSARVIRDAAAGRTG